MSEKDGGPAFEKVIRDGKVAVLYSPGFGAGWSTWCGEYEEFTLFDSGLVALAEAGANAEQVEEYIASKGIDYLYAGGWENITIEWLDQGTRFVVEEYDGSERIRTVDDRAFTA